MKLFRIAGIVGVSLLVVYSLGVTIMWQRAEARIFQTQIVAQSILAQGAQLGQDTMVRDIAAALGRSADVQGADAVLSLSRQGASVVTLRGDGTWASPLVRMVGR